MQSNYIESPDFIILKTCEGKVVVHTLHGPNPLEFLQDIGTILWEEIYCPEISSEILQIYIEGRECYRPELKLDGTVRIHSSPITDDPEDRIMEYHFPRRHPYWQAPGSFNYKDILKKTGL